MARNSTWDKSGNFRLASPPASVLACANAGREPSKHAAPAAIPNFVSRHPRDKALLNHVRINTPPQNSNVGLFVPFFSANSGTPIHRIRYSFPGALPDKQELPL